MKAVFVLDESVSWQSCAKDKANPASLSHDQRFGFTFQWAFVALWMMPVPLTKAPSLAEEIDLAHILSSLFYRHDICIETISVRKFAPHPSK